MTDANEWMKSLGPEYTSDEPEFMIEFGRAMAEWGNIEHSLSSIFALVLRVKKPQHARAAFHSIIGFKDRMNAISVPMKLVTSYYLDDYWPPLRKEWERLESLIQKASKKRNSIAHMHVWHGPTYGTFGWKDITRLQTLPADPKERMDLTITPNKLRDYRKSFVILRRRLRQFEIELEAAFKKSESKYDNADTH